MPRYVSVLLPMLPVPHKSCNAQFSNISRDVKTADNVKWDDKERECFISVTSGVLQRSHVLSMRSNEGKALSTEQIDAAFAEPRDQPSIIVAPPSGMFKDGLSRRFPGGYWSHIQRKSNRTTWGVLYIQPKEFGADELFDYFTSFGIKVTPACLTIDDDSE